MHVVLGSSGQTLKTYVYLSLRMVYKYINMCGNLPTIIYIYICCPLCPGFSNKLVDAPLHFVNTQTALWVLEQPLRSGTGQGKAGWMETTGQEVKGSYGGPIQGFQGKAALQGYEASQENRDS